jgi:hypothetical protein
MSALLLPLEKLPGFEPYGLRLVALPSGTAIDLQDANARDAVARWVAKTLGRPIGSTAPDWHAHDGFWYLGAVGFAATMEQIDFCNRCRAENAPHAEDRCPACKAEGTTISTWGEAQAMRFRTGERYEGWSRYGTADLEGYGTAPVPALDDLDPTDKTALPDGSRSVDALALLTVAAHIGARP